MIIYILLFFTLRRIDFSIGDQVPSQVMHQAGTKSCKFIQLHLHMSATHAAET